MQPGLSGLTQPQAIFDAATFLSICPAPYTAVTCPKHTASSAADSISGPTSTFLGQNIKSDTVELQYDFSKHLSARIGYEYTNRTIADFDATFYSAETYFPGGVGGTAANDHFAARGDCATPSACTETVDPVTGQLISLSFSGPAAGNDTSRNITGISESTLVAGFTARPSDALRITGDFQFGYNDYSFTRISPRQVQSYKVHASYRPRAWINLDGAVDIHENRDNVSTVNDLEHGRSYSLGTTFLPNANLSFDLGYTYTDLYTQALICYYENANGPPPATQCPASLGYVPAAVPGLGSYSSKQHFAYADIRWKPTKRVTTSVGYAGTFVGGNTLTIDPLQVPGTLAFNYQKPYVTLIFDVYKGLSYRTTWNYYGYNGKGLGSNAIPGLAAIPIQDFNGSTAEFAFRYAF
jgi:opacity protein-like surface antigen